MPSNHKYESMEPRWLPTDENNKRLIPAPHPYRHYLPIQTRFTDFDMLGHMNNNVYMALMDMGKADYFERVTEGRVDWKNPGMVVVNITCDYHAPAYPDESIELYTTVTCVGERSLTLDQRIVNAMTLEVKCVATTVMAGFDTATSASRPIPAEWVRALERYEQRSYSKKHE